MTSPTSSTHREPIESQGPYSNTVRFAEVQHTLIQTNPQITDPANPNTEESSHTIIEDCKLIWEDCEPIDPPPPYVPPQRSWREIENNDEKETASTSSFFAEGSVTAGIEGWARKKYQQWKFTEENWGKKGDWVPNIVKNKLVTHFSKKVKDALNSKAAENRQTILNSLTDPENFNKCEAIIVNYVVSYIASKMDSINKSLGPNAFENYKFHDPDLIRGLLLRIFMASVPFDGSKITSEKLLTDGLIEILSEIQSLSDSVEEVFKFQHDYRNRNSPIDKNKEKQLQKLVQDRVEVFLTKYFPNKGAEFGSWFSTGLVRGGIWSTLTEGIAAIFNSYEKMRQNDPDPEIAPSPLVCQRKSIPKINSFVRSTSEHVMAFVKSSFKDPETIEDMFQGLKSVISSDHFLENHPDTLKFVVRNIFTSKDPRVRQLFTRGLGYIEHIVLNFINNEAKQIERTIDPINDEGKDLDLSKLLGMGLESLFGDAYNLFNSIKSQSTSLNFDEVLKSESLKFLEKRFPNKHRDFPNILRFLLGGNEKSWKSLVEKFTSIVLKFYRPIYEQPIILEEYKTKLRRKIHDESDPEATSVKIQRAIDISQGIANDIFDGIHQKLTKTTKDEKGQVVPVIVENEFEDIEKLFQLLKPDNEPDLPEKHPNEVLQGFKFFLLSQNDASVNIQNALRTYLGELVFKAGVNLVYEADNDPDNPCPKHLLVAKGFRHLLSLFCVNQDMTELHQYISKREKPLSPDPLKLKENTENRFAERKKFIHGESEKPPKLVNHLLKTLFPDLPRHIPLIPSLNKKLCSKIEKDLAPDFIISNYEKSTIWIKQLQENEKYIENFIKEGPPEKREFGKRILDNCDVVSQFILDLVPNMFETDSEVFGEMLYGMLKDYLPPIKDPRTFVTFLSENFKVLGNPRDRVMIETQSCLKNYIYAACIKVYVQALKKVESLGKDLDNFTVTDLVNMCLEELNNFIHPLNQALNDHNDQRLFTRIRHISQLPPEDVNRALNLPLAKRKRLIDGKFVEQNEVSLHPSLATDGIENPESAELRRHTRLYLPIANGIMQFCDLANPKLQKPLPDAIESKVWRSITTKGVPKFVEWLMKTLNNDATKTGLIHTLISKFEHDLQLRKNAGENIDDPISDSPIHPLSSESKKTLRKCVKTIIQLAPQNLLIFAYKYFPDVKEKINERLEDALTEFLAKFTLVDLLDVTVSGVTSSIKERGEYDRYTNSYRFKFPTTPEEVAAEQASQRRKRADAENGAREGLLNIVEGGIRTYRKRQWDGFVDSTAQKIEEGLRDKFYGVGNAILSILNFLYKYVVVKIINFIFSKTLESVVSFFDRLFARYIRRDIEPQIRIVSMPGVDSLVNNVMTRGFEILNTTHERAAAEESAKETAKKTDEVVRDTLPLQ